MYPKFNVAKDVIKTSDSRAATTVKACQEACASEDSCKNFMFRIVRKVGEDKVTHVCHLFNKDEMEIERVDDNYRYAFTGPKKCPKKANDCGAYDVES